MRFFFKWLFRLCVLTIIVLVIVLFSLNAIVRSALEESIRKQTGMETKIGQVDVGILSPTVTVENLKMYNTAEFGGTSFLDVPEIHFEYTRLSLLKFKPHFTLLRLHLAELNVVRGDKGKVNTSAAKVLPVRRGNRLASFEFGGVDVLNLSLGRIRLVDLNNQKNDRTWNLGIQERIYHNVKTTGDLQGILFLIWLQNGGEGLFPSPS